MVNKVKHFKQSNIFHMVKFQSFFFMVHHEWIVPIGPTCGARMMPMVLLYGSSWESRCSEGSKTHARVVGPFNTSRFGTYITYMYIYTHMYHTHIYNLYIIIYIYTYIYLYIWIYIHNKKKYIHTYNWYIMDIHGHEIGTLNLPSFSCCFDWVCWCYSISPQATM